MDFSTNSTLIPQFKTFFYIYKNNSVDQEFRNMLINDYLVDVKDIERFDMDFDSTRSEQAAPSSNSKDIFQFDDLKNSDPNDLNDFDSLKIADIDSTVDDAIADYDQLDKDEKSKVSKFDKEIDDKQYVEKSEIVTEMPENDEATLTTTDGVSENESGPEKITLPIKKYMDDSMEIMEAQENRNFVTRVILK